MCQPALMYPSPRASLSWQSNFFPDQRTFVIDVDAEREGLRPQTPGAKASPRAAQGEGDWPGDALQSPREQGVWVTFTQPLAGSPSAAVSSAPWTQASHLSSPTLVIQVDDSDGEKSQWSPAPQQRGVLHSRLGRKQGEQAEGQLGLSPLGRRMHIRKETAPAMLAQQCPEMPLVRAPAAMPLVRGERSLDRPRRSKLLPHSGSVGGQAPCEGRRAWASLLPEAAGTKAPGMPRIPRVPVVPVVPMESVRVAVSQQLPGTFLKQDAKLDSSSSSSSSAWGVARVKKCQIPRAASVDSGAETGDLESKLEQLSLHRSIQAAKCQKFLDYLETTQSPETTDKPRRAGQQRRLPRASSIQTMSTFSSEHTKPSRHADSTASSPFESLPRVLSSSGKPRSKVLGSREHHHHRLETHRSSGFQPSVQSSRKQHLRSSTSGYLTLVSNSEPSLCQELCF